MTTKEMSEALGKVLYALETYDLSKLDERHQKYFNDRLATAVGDVGHAQDIVDQLHETEHPELSL